MADRTRVSDRMSLEKRGSYRIAGGRGFYLQNRLATGVQRHIQRVADAVQVGKPGGGGPLLQLQSGRLAVTRVGQERQNLLRRCHSHPVDEEWVDVHGLNSTLDPRKVVNQSIIFEIDQMHHTAPKCPTGAAGVERAGCDLAPF